MEDSYRYIVYVENADEGYYSSYYTEKESNKIEDIIAIFRTEEKAKKICARGDGIWVIDKLFGRIKPCVLFVIVMEKCSAILV